jgi:dolichol-phosphate mannosyltransferase
MTSNPYISVIIPIYNEEENILPLYKRLKDTLNKINKNHEMLFVNDCSKDQSKHIIKSLHTQDKSVKYLEFSRNFGHQIAVTAGLDFTKGDLVAVIDADLQDPPELLIDMHEKIKENYDVVYAKRRKRKDKSVVKKVAYKIFYRLLSIISQVDIPLDTGDYRLMKKHIVDELKTMKESNKFLRGQIAWLGFNQTFVEYDRDQRAAGEPGYSYRKLFRLALDGITSFSSMPLRIATVSGFIVFFISCILMVYTLYAYFFDEFTPKGWSSLMISILFIGGIQLMCLGIIGEYIGKILNDVRKRPLYVLKEQSTE